MHCLCVDVYCHQVTTQLQLINIIYLLKTKEKAQIVIHKLKQGANYVNVIR